jgi:exonuclease 3'-5' domain-containing protein 1
MELYDFLKDTAKLLQGKKDAVRFAVDLEGVDLGKPPGSADILQIHNGANNKTYIIDLLTLQFSAFLMTAPGLTLTLKQVLESPNIPKYFHDVRNDSNALWFHYKISLEGTLDTQIMQNVVYTSRDENDCRYPKKDRIVGLSLCMEEERMLLTWEEQVEFNRNKQLFQRGDDWSVMRIRPMPERVIKYCTNDVKYLLRLVDRYDGLVRDEKQKRMYTLESERRIAESKMEEYEPRADTEEERKKRIRAPSWNYWRVNDRRHLLLEQQIGSRPVCQPDCTGFWEQTHVCTPGCACHATCLARQKKNSAWYDAQTLDVKIDWCRKVSEAHTAGCRFEWSDILLRDEENPSATDYMPPPAPPLDDKDWAEIEQPPSSPWEEEVEREDEREDHHSHHEELQQEDTQQEDLQQGEAHPDETEPDEVQQETIQHDNGKTQETEYHHPSSSPGPGNDRPSQSWNLLSFLSSPGPKSG